VSSLGIASSGAAEPLEVATRRCTWLDPDELARLTRLELSAAARQADTLRVDYSCRGNDVTIGIANRDTGIRVERLITGACCADVEPERTLALLSLGLFRAAEALLGADATDGAFPNGRAKGVTVVLPAQPAGDRQADGGVARATIDSPQAVPTGAAPTTAGQAPPAVSPAPGHSSWTPAGATPAADSGPDATAEVTDYVHQLGPVGHVRIYNLEDALVGYGFGVRYRAWPWRTVALGGNLDASFGSTSRIGGDVHARLLSLGAAAGWRFADWSTLALTATVEGGATLVTVAGDATEANYGAESVTGLTGHLGLELTPSFRSGRVEVGLPLEVGALFRAPRGVVPDGSTIQLDGVRLGVGLALTLGWVQQPSARAQSVARTRGGAR